MTFRLITPNHFVYTLEVQPVYTSHNKLDMKAMIDIVKKVAGYDATFTVVN
jgi:hypothetical protein